MPQPRNTVPSMSSRRHRKKALTFVRWASPEWLYAVSSTVVNKFRRWCCIKVKDWRVSDEVLDRTDLTRNGPFPPYSSNQQALILLMEKGGNINRLLTHYSKNHSGFSYVNHKGNNALHVAVIQGSYDYVAALLCCNADPSFPDHNGTTPIIKALKISPAITELLLLYESDFKQVDKFGRSILTTAIAHQSCHIQEIIQRGGHFRNLFVDNYLLQTVAQRNDLEEFKWLWDNFKYKKAWQCPYSILDYLLDFRRYEMFEYIIEHPKMAEVFYILHNRDRRNERDDDKVGSTYIYGSPCHFRVKNHLMMRIMLAINDGYKIKKAEEAIYILLTYGYVPCEHEAVMIFNTFGYGDLFELLLYLDIVGGKRDSDYQPLMCKILMHPERSIKDMIQTFIPRRFTLSDRRSLLLLFQHIYDLGLLDYLLDRLTEESDDEQSFSPPNLNTFPTRVQLLEVVMKLRSQRTVPSLVDLSRNTARLGIWQGCNIRSSKQFYDTLTWLVPACIKDIIMFQIPVYDISTEAYKNIFCDTSIEQA